MNNQKWIIIRVEDLFYKNENWNNLYLSDNRKVLNSIIDKGYKISLISSFDIHRLKEIKNNLFLSNDCYLIGFNGAQILNCQNNKEILDNTFTEHDSKLMKDIIDRIIFDEVGKVSVKIIKNNGDIELVKTECKSFEISKQKLLNKAIDFIEIDEYKSSKNISTISISFDNKNSIPSILMLLKKYDSHFHCLYLDQNTINLYPIGSSISNAINTIKRKDKTYCFEKENIISIGYTYSDIELFEVTGYNICNEESPDALKKLSEYTYVGELSKLIEVSLKEKFLK